MKYTGYTGVKSDGKAIEKLVWLCGRRWRAKSLGTYVDRDKIGKPGEKSVHADYRAADIQFPDAKSRALALETLAGLYGVELIIDYQYRGKMRRAYGRGWRCDRRTWMPYAKGVLSQGGQPWADWLHVEVAPWTDPETLDLAFRATKHG